MAEPESNLGNLSSNACPCPPCLTTHVTRPLLAASPRISGVLVLQMERATHSYSRTTRFWTAPYGNLMWAWQLLTTAPSSSGLWLPRHLHVYSGGPSQSCARTSKPGSNTGLGYRRQPSRDRGGQPGLGWRPCHLYKGPCASKTRVEGENRGTVSTPENRKEVRKPRGLLADPYYAQYMPDTSFHKPGILILK